MSAVQEGTDGVPVLQLRTHAFRSEYCKICLSDDCNICNYGLPLNFIIIDDELLLQDFDSIQAIRFLLLRQHNLPKVTFAKDCQEVEVVQPNFPLARWLTNWWRLTRTGCELRWR